MLRCKVVEWTGPVLDCSAPGRAFRSRAVSCGYGGGGDGGGDVFLTLRVSDNSKCMSRPNAWPQNHTRELFGWENSAYLLP